MTTRQHLGLIAFALSAILFFPLSEYLATSPIGTQLLLHGQVLYILSATIVLLSMPMVTLGLFMPSYRRHATIFLPHSLLVIACCLVGGLLGEQLRMAGMKRCVERSRELISAIEKFEQTNEGPPSTLEALVPDFLARIPSTGMMAYPKYEYLAGQKTSELYHGNPWVLSIYTPKAGINGDRLLYFPKQNYPTQGFGGSLERVGTWAYVHE